jgi:hypothetical protein
MLAVSFEFAFISCGNGYVSGTLETVDARMPGSGIIIRDAGISSDSGIDSAMNDASIFDSAIADVNNDIDSNNIEADSLQCPGLVCLFSNCPIGAHGTAGGYCGKGSTICASCEIDASCIGTWSDDASCVGNVEVL